MVDPRFRGNEKPESHPVGRASLRANLANEQERQDWLTFPRRVSLGIPPRFAGRRLAGTLALPVSEALTLSDIPSDLGKNQDQTES
jgi:hypothetical protein